MDAVKGDGQTIVTVKIAGTFDRTGLLDLLLMDHCFTVVGDQNCDVDLSVGHRLKRRNADMKTKLIPEQNNLREQVHLKAIALPDVVRYSAT